MKFTKKQKESGSDIINVVESILLIIGSISLVALQFAEELGVADHPLLLIPRAIVAFDLCVACVAILFHFIGFERCDDCKKFYRASQQKVSATRLGNEERPKFGSDYSVKVRFDVQRPCCGKTTCEVCTVVGDCRGVSNTDIRREAKSKFGVSHFSLSVNGLLFD